MTDSPSPIQDEQQPTADAVTGGGGMTAAEQLANDPVRNAAAKLELLSEATREQVLAKMDPSIADRIRQQIASSTRPHGDFSTDVATRRRMINDLAGRVQAQKTAQVDRMVEELAHVPAMAPQQIGGGVPQPMAQPAAPNGQPAAYAHPLDALRELHPAAIARAMQGERAEAWSIVLERLDDNARAALQLYLDSTARTAIEDARQRQAELAASSPALLATIVAAIARTVVPRAMREHHQLLSTTPLTWAVGGHA
ncbi:MAG: hypothetical protein JWM86_2468 [Thermoleophilia bacterium]|nr:hypothetical protein [Thermoleophilia bacterium]